MHLYVMARGQVDRLNRWENDLSSKYLPYAVGKVHPEINNGKQDITKPYQFNVRPIRLYELAFPEPCMQDVLSMVSPNTAWNKRYDYYSMMIRKALGLDKIPEFKQNTHDIVNSPLLLNKQWIDCTGIGMKKDRYENGIEQI